MLKMFMFKIIILPVFFVLGFVFSFFCHIYTIKSNVCNFYVG